ncbi:hypothetical protein RUND412_007330 [Rhizina undulata]
MSFIFDDNNWANLLPEAIFGHWRRTLLSLFFIHLFGKIIWRRWFSPLSKFPGPFWASTTTLYSFFVNVSGRQHLVQYELHKKYGPIVRYKPNLLVISEPTMLPVIYHRYADKTPFYNQLMGVTTAFTSLKHEDHSIARRRIATPYSSKTVKRLEGKVDTWLREWTEKLRNRFFETGKSQDFNNQLIWLSYDMFADCTYGRPLGFLAADSDVKSIITGSVSLTLTHQAIRLVPSLSWWLKNTWFGRTFVLPKPHKDFGPGFLMAEAVRIVQSEEVDPSDPTFIHMFMVAKNPDGTSMTMDQLGSEARILLVGAATPTASTTVELLLNVLDTPGCYEKIAAEIEEAESKGQLSNPVATYAEAQSLVYFSACIRETLRGAESTITMVPRMVAKGGTMILNKFVPEGTHLSATPWIIHRNRKLYGEDAEFFRPERWLEASPEQLQLWNKYDFQFGYGARACIGKNIGLMAIHKLALQILRNFKVQRLNETRTQVNGFTAQLNEKMRRNDPGLFIVPLRPEKSTV